MTNAALQFSDADRLGRVASVDTTRIYIGVENHELVTRLSVGKLIAVQGSSALEYLIGIVERVTRQIREEVLLRDEDQHGNVPIGETKEDTIRAVLIGTYRLRDAEKSNVFKRGTHTFPQIDRDCFVIADMNLQRLMNLLAKDLPLDKHLKLGRFSLDPSALAIADGDRFFQRHACILGSTGPGKSWTVALILERARQLNHPNVIVLDMHGEYDPLVSDSKRYAAGFKIAGPGDLQNPECGILFLPYWLLNREEMLAMLLDRSDQNAPNQAARFTTHVRNLKEEMLRHCKQARALATFTVDSPVPYEMKYLIDRLYDDNRERDYSHSQTGRAGEWNNKLTRFISRLEAKMEDRRYGFLFQPPPEVNDYSWLGTQIIRLLGADGDSKGIKVVDFSEVPSDVLPIVVGVFARLLYDVQFWLEPEKRTPFTLICDEAHLYLPVREETDAIERRAVDAFERIAKEGRKYGVSLLVVSQRPSDVSRTILSQCNNFVVLRLTNDQDQNVVRRLMPDSMSGLTDVMPLLDLGEALLLGDAVLLPTRIVLDAPEVEPASGTRDFWTEWNSRKPDPEAILAAVETMRCQTRLGSTAES